MPQLTVKRTINAEATHVWSILADFGGIHRFHPAVESSPILNGQQTGIGAERACHFYDGSSIKEEITAFDEGRSMTVEIKEISAPLEHVRGVLRVESLAPGRSEVEFEMDYRPKFGPVGSLMNAVMIRPQFRKVLGSVLDGLAVHAETGALVGKDGEVSNPVRPLAA